MVSVSSFPKTRHDIQPKRLATQGQGIFLLWTVDHCLPRTSRMPTFEKMAHHLHLLIESHDPALLVIAFLHRLMTGRTGLSWRL